MTPEQIKNLGDSIVSILVSYAAHGTATSSLHGMGEITLRDGLIVASASVAAVSRQAWILEPDVSLTDWPDAQVDIMISRKGNNQNITPIAGVELKWWRAVDGKNAANRRRELLRDFIRAAALYTLVDDIALVALLSTSGSWSATAGTTGTDSTVMKMLTATSKQKWNLSKLNASAALKAAMKGLMGKVPVCNIFHTELLSDCEFRLAGEQIAFARAWAVRKPQKTKFLDDSQIQKLTK